MSKVKILVYALVMGVLFFLFKWIENKFVFGDFSPKIFIGCIALFFLILGVWLAKHLFKPSIQLVEKTIFVENTDSELDAEAIVHLGLTQREMQVLQLMANGLSNNEIADQLHLSLHTIKSHSSKLFDKLDVKRRTQAVEVAKSLKIIQ